MNSVENEIQAMVDWETEACDRRDAEVLVPPRSHIPASFALKVAHQSYPFGCCNAKISVVA